jgi:hypothetical protein
MSSGYSPDLRIELIANGEQSGTWGNTTNINLGDIIEDAISGLTTVTTAAAQEALTALYGAPDQARAAALDLDTATAADYEVFVPPATKLYVIKNSSSLYNVKVFCSTTLGNTTAAGTDVEIPPGKTVLVRSDGINIVEQLDYIVGSLGVGTTLDVGTDLTVGDTATADKVIGTTNLIAPINTTALPTSTVATAITSSEVSALTLINAASFSTSGIVMLDSEQISFGGKAGNVLNTLTRGVGGSGAVAHAANAVVTELTNAEMLVQSNITWNSGSEVLAVGAGDRTRFYVDTVSAQSLTNKTMLGTYVNGQYLGNTVAISGTAIDCSLGNYFTKDITTATTFSFSSVPSQVYSMTVEVGTDSGGLPTWPASVYWPDGIDPSTFIITTGPKVNLFMFVTNDSGSTWHGAGLVNYAA